MIALLLFAQTEIATPTPAPPVFRLAAGFEHRDAIGPSGTKLNSFAYPNLAFTADGSLGVIEASSPLPILLADGIGAAIDFLGGGPGDIPLWMAINGKREPCAITLWDLGARLSVPLGDRVAFEAGGRTWFRFTGILIPGEDERISVQPFSALSTFGVRGGDLDGVVVRGTFHAGNAFTRFTNWNPVGGGDLRVTVPVGSRVALEALGGAQVIRFDLRPYQEPITQRHIAGVGWYTFWNVEARIAIRMPTKPY